MAVANVRCAVKEAAKPVDVIVVEGRSSAGEPGALLGMRSPARPAKRPWRVPTTTMRMGAMPHWLELEQRRSVILPLQQVAVWIHIADPGVGHKRHIG